MGWINAFNNSDRLGLSQKIALLSFNIQAMFGG